MADLTVNINGAPTPIYLGENTAEAARQASVAGEKAALAAAWAEGTEPGGVGTKSAKEHAADAAASAASIGTLPTRVTVLEGFAKRFDSGETALSAITGAVPGSILDPREGMDIAAARVREWKTQSRTISYLQETLSARPTFDPALRRLDFGSGTGSLVGYPTATYRDLSILPDSTISPMVGGGAVWCGLALRPDMHLVMTNDGRRIANAADWTAGNNGGTAAYATLAVMAKGSRPSIKYEWNLRTLTAGVSGFLGSAQGVACTNDGTNDFYWPADHAAGKVRCIRDNGDGTATHVAANDISPNHGTAAGDANGVAIQTSTNEIFIMQAGTGAAYPTCSVHDITLTAGVPAKTFKRSFIIPDKNADGLTIWRGFLLVTAGGNGEYGDVWVFTPDGKFVTKLNNLPGAQSVEHIAGEDLSGRLYIVHDGKYHTQGAVDSAVICTYDTSGIDAGVNYTPTRALIMFTGGLNTGVSTPLLALGQVTTSGGGDCGWGLYRNNGNNTLRLIGVQRGTSYAAYITVASMTTDAIHAIDVSTDTGVINSWRVNGVAQTVTGNLTNFTYGLSGLGGVLGAEMAPNGAVRNPGYTRIRSRGMWSLDDITGDAVAVAARISAAESAVNTNLAMGLL